METSQRFYKIQSIPSAVAVRIVRIGKRIKKIEKKVFKTGILKMGKDKDKKVYSYESN